MDARLPNLVIVGVHRGGTTSLFRYLAQHPDVYTAAIKEVWFFQPLRYGQPLGPIEDYAAHFRGWSGQRYVLEGTAGYFYGGRPVAEAMRETLGDVRTVVSLREPVDRCWSWYAFMRSRGRLPDGLGFTGYLDRCVALRASGADDTHDQVAYWGLSGGCYDTWADGWLEVMGDRLRVGFFDDLVRDPAESVRGLCRWLGIDTGVAAGFHFSTENRAVQHRSRSLDALALRVNRAGAGFLTRHPAARRGLRTAYDRLSRDPGPLRMSPIEHDRLQEFYAPHNAALRTSLLRHGVADLPGWLQG